MDYIYDVEGIEIRIEQQVKRMSDDIVDQLVAYRKKMEMTQQDIADGTGIKRANIARIESKKCVTSLECLIKYAQCLDLNLKLELE